MIGWVLVVGGRYVNGGFGEVEWIGGNWKGKEIVEYEVI
jgi:hypothetical protein